MSMLPTVPTHLPDNAVHVWLFPVTRLASGGVRQAAQSLLAPEERARAARFRFERDRDAFTAARALARIALAQYADTKPQALTFVTNPYGKPSLTDPIDGRQLLFNVSRTRELVACAVTWKREIGVDVELVADPPWEVAERFFAPPEIEDLSRLPPAERRRAFYEVWTLKEAFIKAVGLGLSMPLDQFAVRRWPPGLLAYASMTTPGRWHCSRLTPTADCTLALCVAVSDDTHPVTQAVWLDPERILAAAASASNTRGDLPGPRGVSL